MDWGDDGWAAATDVIKRSTTKAAASRGLNEMNLTARSPEICRQDMPG